MNEDPNFYGAYTTFYVSSFMKNLKRKFESLEEYDDYNFDFVCKLLHRHCQNNDEILLNCLKYSNFWKKVSDYQKTKIHFEHGYGSFVWVARRFLHHFYRKKGLFTFSFASSHTNNLLHKRIKDCLRPDIPEQSKIDEFIEKFISSQDVPTSSSFCENLSDSIENINSRRTPQKFIEKKPLIPNISMVQNFSNNSLIPKIYSTKSFSPKPKEKSLNLSQTLNLNDFVLDPSSIEILDKHLSSFCSELRFPRIQKANMNFGPSENIINTNQFEILPGPSRSRCSFRRDCSKLRNKNNELSLYDFDSTDDDDDMFEIQQNFGSKKNQFRSYTLDEEDVILKFVFNTQKPSAQSLLIGGNRYWQIAERELRKQNLLQRSWESMKEHFKREIVPKIHLYNDLYTSHHRKVVINIYKAFVKREFKEYILKYDSQRAN